MFCTVLVYSSLTLTVILLTIRNGEGGNTSGKLIIGTRKHALEVMIIPHRNFHQISMRERNKAQVVVGFDIMPTLKQSNGRQSLKNTHHRSKRKAVRLPIYHWPNGIVPYSYHPSIEYANRRIPHVIRAAMNHWEKHTCIKFEEQRYNMPRIRDRLIVKRGEWCSSHLGRVGGDQFLYVHRECLTVGTIIHELGHTIGWIHEQARPDRDRHISSSSMTTTRTISSKLFRVIFDRIPRAYRDQYQKEPWKFVDTKDLPYDYDSIMHYPDNDGELITVDRRAQHRIGQREKLSFYDKKLANIMYNCNVDMCGWQKVPMSYVAMDDETSNVSYDTTLNQCKLVCLEEQQFRCNSIMFRKFRTDGGTICVHTQANRATHEEKHDSRIDYYEIMQCNTN
ncbi:zinc metalloproteinase nas-30-like isoform X4 [Tubulanus polymorphus]|uniref:zinc metalloproteinase nas-30-like isoform X4 n=1 Tax=Tubulanus polymorphus TaxID=672921 RepID=UPI003DA2EB2E